MLRPSFGLVLSPLPCVHTYLQLPPSSTQPENRRAREKALMAVVPGGFPSCPGAGRKESSDRCPPTLLPCKMGSPHYRLRPAELLLLGAAGNCGHAAHRVAQTSLVEMLTSASRSSWSRGGGWGQRSTRAALQLGRRLPARFGASRSLLPWGCSQDISSALPRRGRRGQDLSPLRDLSLANEGTPDLKRSWKH